MNGYGPGKGQGLANVQLAPSAELYCDSCGDVIYGPPVTLTAGHIPDTYWYHEGCEPAQGDVMPWDKPEVTE